MVTWLPGRPHEPPRFETGPVAQRGALGTRVGAGDCAAAGFCAGAGGGVLLLIATLFALANAGIPLRLEAFPEMISEPVVLGVFAGLVAGKAIGITGSCWLALKLRIGARPDDISLSHVLGLGWVAGIGFTMSIFIADLAFAQDPGVLVAAKSAILAGSVTASALGLLWLARVGSKD